ncbi:MAG: hypothetical protein IPK81_16430 [Rhodospirillales bacterium]|nr:MAG: hypothetical protein IPK81_16430 [Rhodospirillales bacterium]
MDTRTLLDPTGELQVVGRQKPARPPSLDGVTIGLLDIAKARGNIFLDRLDHRLTERGFTVKRYAKATPSRLAPLELRQKIAEEVKIVVEGLAD